MGRRSTRELGIPDRHSIGQEAPRARATQERRTGMSLSDARLAELCADVQGWPELVDRRDVLMSLRELQSLRAAQAKGVEALQGIARQVLPEDMSVDQQLDADFEGAC